MTKKTGVVPCSLEDCNLLYVSKGLCGKHYHKLRKYGDPKGGGYEIATSDEQYLNQRHKKMPSGCWEWQILSSKGYGKAKPFGLTQEDRNKKSQTAHRYAYETWVGPIPGGLVVHHKCANRSCINPDHLQAITHEQNLAEMLERSAYLKEIADLKKEVRRLKQKLKECNV